MAYDHYFFANITIWISCFIFAASMVPQIVMNYRLKSTTGLSDLYLLAILNTQTCYVGFTFSVDLPLVYKVMNVLYAVLFFIIIFHNFFYYKNNKNNRFLKIYVLNIVISIFIVFYAIVYSVNLGHILGWIPIFVHLIERVPQVYKVHSLKSVRGFSLYFVLINLLAFSFEGFSAWILKLPSQILYGDLKGIAFCLVFLLQFYLYKNNE